MECKHNIEKWCEENKENFLPPVCNKLMHKNQLSIMFIGGPNERTDFHLDEGSELFYMKKGNMSLLTIQRGRKKVVHIKEGQIYLLPSRVPHSPQRMAGTLGMVIERSRDMDEMDGLRWYTDINTCDRVLWERYFHCGDLGRDLVPVVMEFRESEERRTNEPGNNVVKNPPLEQDMNTIVPDPISLPDWIAQKSSQLSAGKSLDLFVGHPDKEFSVKIIGGPSIQSTTFKHETWLYQLKGDIKILIEGRLDTLKEGECCVIRSGQAYTVERTRESIGMVVTQDPLGNKQNRSHMTNSV